MAIPLACDMRAIPAAERGEHDRVTRLLVASAAVIRESPNGYAFQLSADHFVTASQFIARERLCCPFLQFALDVPAGRGPISLRVSGPAGAQELIRAELHLP
jgi:hypothetical protein